MAVPEGLSLIVAVVTDMDDAGLAGDISLVSGITSEGKSGLGAAT